MTSVRIAKLKKVKFGSLQMLIGWKAIAAHIGVSARTVQRWVHINGFPKIILNPGEKKSIIATEKNLLTIWLSNLAQKTQDNKTK